MEKRLRGTRGEGTAKNCSIRAGNSHNRELFISSVDRSVTVDDFKSYLSQCNIKYVDVNQISSDSARYRSFKLTVHKEQYVLCFTVSYGLKELEFEHIYHLVDIESLTDIFPSY